MRNVLLMAILVLAWQAQAQKKGDVEFGFSSGMNLSHVSSASTGTGINNKPRTAFNAGISANFFLTSHWSLKGKLIYDQKGLNGDNIRIPMDEASGYSYRDVNSNYELDYLTLPITMNFQFGNKVNFALGVGGYAGYLLNSNEADYQLIYRSNFHFKTTDFGAVGTIAIKYPLTNAVGIGFEYERQQGFSNIYPSPYKSHLNSRDSFNLGICYTL